MFFSLLIINLLLELMIGVEKMNGTVIEMQAEYTAVTYELLDRLDNLKKKTKESMTVGELNILKGIMIVEEAVRAINPNILDDDSISMIQKCVDIVIYKENEKGRHINSHMRYGIDMCYMMIDILNRSKNNKFVLKISIII